MKKIALIITILFLTACSHKEEKMSAELEANIIKKCLVMMEKNGHNAYVVCPRFQNFNFNSFLRENSKGYPYDERTPEILDSLGWDKKHFKEVQQKVNKEYQNTSNSEFSKLSKSKLHNEVVFISGISENLVFITIVNYCNAVKNSELVSPSFNKSQRYSSMVSFAFILKDGEVKNQMIDGNQVKEYQCNDSDIQFDENGKRIKIWED